MMITKIFHRENKPRLLTAKVKNMIIPYKERGFYFS